MAGAIPIAEAQLISFLAESVTYGIYLLTLGLCVHVLVWRPVEKKHRQRDSCLVIVVTLMCVILTLDMALTVRHNLDAFCLYVGPGGATVEFENISYWVNVMKTVNVQIMALVGDGMLIYRCLVIFGKQWYIIALPGILWVANAICSGIIVYVTATLGTNALLSNTTLSPFIIVFLVMTLVINVFTTGLIVWRIWSIDRETAAYYRASGTGIVPHRSRLAHVIRIMVESGLLYTVFVFIAFVTEITKSNAMYIVSDVMLVCIGISFNLIIIRVHQGTAMGSVQTPASLKRPPQYLAHHLI